MTTVKELEKKLKQPANLLLAKASSLGFTGSPTDELPADIEKAIANGGAKKLNAAPPDQKTKPTGNGKQTPRQGQNDEGNIHAAFFSSTDNAFKNTQATGIAAAEAMGAMVGHQEFMHFLGAKNATFNTLMQRHQQAIETQFLGESQDYQQDLAAQERLAIAEVAANTAGKSVSQVRQEMTATIDRLRLRSAQ